jgi:Tol biopolymer transport system component
VARSLSRLTVGTGLQVDPAWSPGGDFIAYASDRAGNFDIWIQPVGGGEARQLTRSKADDIQPSWSPDGRSIAFRSERNNGGIYVVPVGGGAERQLTSFGESPRWSGNGALTFVTSNADREAPQGIFEVSLDGGAPHPLCANFLAGGVWDWICRRGDGRVSAFGVDRARTLGFYTVSTDGKQVVASQIPPDFPIHFGAGGADVARFDWDQSGTAIYLEVVQRNLSDIWKVRVDAQSLAWLGAERLTTGPARDIDVAVSPDGRHLAFTSETELTRLWRFPLQANEGRIAHQGIPVTDETASIGQSALSRDGSKIAYLRQEAGVDRSEMWVSNSDGTHRILVGEGAPGAWSPDGLSLAYGIGRVDGTPLGSWAFAIQRLGERESIVGGWSGERVFFPTDWPSEGDALIGVYVAPLYGQAVIARWPLAGQGNQMSVIASDPACNLWQPSVSPNGRWLTFTTQPHASLHRNGIAVTPIEGSPSDRWLRIAPTHSWVDKPRWSPDGRLLYFVSREHKDVFNLWATRFDPDSGRPIGEPFEVTHFDSTVWEVAPGAPRQRLSPEVPDGEIGISTKFALLTMAARSGSIWMLDNVDR